MDNEITTTKTADSVTNASHIKEPSSNFNESLSNITASNSYSAEPKSNTDSRLVNSNKIDLINNDLKNVKLPTSTGKDSDIAESLNSNNNCNNEIAGDKLLGSDKNSMMKIDGTIVDPINVVDKVEAAEVIEEVLVKTKSKGRTGEDDILIEEWKKSEAKQGSYENKEISKKDNSEESIESRLIGDIVLDTDIPKVKKNIDDIDSRLMEEMFDDWEDFNKNENNIPKQKRDNEECIMVVDKKVDMESGLMGEMLVDITIPEKKGITDIVQEEMVNIDVRKEEPKPSKSVIKKIKLSSKKALKDKESGKNSNPTSDDPKAEERRQKIEERMKKREEKLMKEKNEMKKHQQQLATAMKRLLPEEANDSGVDENTQSKEANYLQPVKNGKISQVKKRQPRSVDPSPMKPRNPQSAASLERNIPMNKIEVGKTASPNIKNVRSKIGSLNNSTYKPGGGNVKIESKKLDFSKASSRITAKNEAYSPGGGDKKIESQKLKWNANSKIGSLEKKDHKPGGGDKKVQSQKLNFKDQAHSKVGSKDNLKHKAGGGDIEIPIEKIDFKAKASSKVGSLDNVKHKAGGGDKKIYDDKEYLKQMHSTTSNPTSSGRASGAISPATTGTNSPGPQEEEESQSQKDE